MRISFNCIKVQYRSIAQRQDTDALNNSFCLDNGWNTFFTNLDTTGMNEIYAFIEPLIFLQMIDTGVNNDPPDPALQCTPVFEGVYLVEDLDKSFLQHIFCVFAVVSIAVANHQHFCTIFLI